MPLLSVLWGVALLSLISLSLLNTTATSRRIAQNTLDAAQAEALAEAAVVRAAVGLADARPNSRWRSGRRERIRLADVDIIIVAQDELGRIDLNLADPALLHGLLRAIGVEGKPAEALVAAITEWRSPGGGSSGGGSSSDAHAAGLLARHGAFQGVDELRLVPGVTSSLYERLAPALTVYSQRQNVDPQLAPKAVLTGLPGMTAEQVVALLSRRDQNPSMTTAIPDLKGRAFSISIELTRSVKKRRYEAVIRFTDDPDKLFWLLHWREIPGFPREADTTIARRSG